MTDADLIARAVAGESRAFAELVKRHQRRAMGVANGILRNHEDAREAVQDAFVQAWKNLPDFDAGGRFDTWLYRIVHNASISLLRRNRRHQAEEFEADEHTATDNPFTNTWFARLSSEAEAAVDQLQPAHYVVMVLREVEGLSYEEIAERTGVPKGTVMSRLYHARQRIGEILRSRLGEGL